MRPKLRTRKGGLPHIDPFPSTVIVSFAFIPCSVVFATMKAYRLVFKYINERLPSGLCRIPLTSIRHFTSSVETRTPFRAGPSRRPDEREPRAKALKLPKYIMYHYNNPFRSLRCAKFYWLGKSLGNSILFKAGLVITGAKEKSIVLLPLSLLERLWDWLTKYGCR